LAALASAPCASPLTALTALVTLDKTDLGAQAGHLPDSLMDDVDRGLRQLLSR
jgi:mRNA-degrading endonuclease toxin of MazEF toxin-antitoxin module